MSDPQITAEHRDASSQNTIWSVSILPLLAISADSPKPDPWAPVRFLVGRWEGTTQGEPGQGTVVRTYEFGLGGRFIHERNTSTYPPQDKNEKGEVHEHWSFLSYDRTRKVLGPDEFTETFQLAEPGKPFQTYSKNHFKRAAA